jgi:hypothetical protein
MVVLGCAYRRAWRQLSREARGGGQRPPVHSVAAQAEVVLDVPGGCVETDRGEKPMSYVSIAINLIVIAVAVFASYEAHCVRKQLSEEQDGERQYEFAEKVRNTARWCIAFAVMVSITCVLDIARETVKILTT